MDEDNKSPAEGKVQVPQVLADAEGVGWWSEMDGPHFADFLLQDMKTVRAEGVEYQIADFCSRDFLIGVWDNSMKALTEWAGEPETVGIKPLVYWASIGTVTGMIYGRNVKAD
jgi:hypothetical protein